MQDQRAAGHPVHRLVEQGCREMGRVRGGHAQRKQPQTTRLPVLVGRAWVERAALGTNPYPETSANSEHLED